MNKILLGIKDITQSMSAKAVSSIRANKARKLETLSPHALGL